MCVWSVCICACMFACVWACVHVEVRGQHWVSSPVLHLIEWGGSLTYTQCSAFQTVWITSLLQRSSASVSHVLILLSNNSPRLTSVLGLLTVLTPMWQMLNPLSYLPISLAVLRKLFIFYPTKYYSIEWLIASNISHLSWWVTLDCEYFYYFFLFDGFFVHLYKKF